MISPVNLHAIDPSPVDLHPIDLSPIDFSPIDLSLSDLSSIDLHIIYLIPSALSPIDLNPIVLIQSINLIDLKHGYLNKQQFGVARWCHLVSNEALKFLSSQEALNSPESLFFQ